MKRNRSGLILFLVGLMWSPAAPCQNYRGVILEFQLVVDGVELVLGSEYQVASHSATIDLLRFYISDIAFYTHSDLLWSESESYHLIDASEPSSLSFLLPYEGEVAFDQLRFQLGIDSATHELGAMSGDLDPTKGMYWSWQSGYINFKLEGTSPQSSGRHNEFQYHLGGYRSPYQTVRDIWVEVESQEKIIVKIDLAQFFESVDIEVEPMIMSPGLKAAELSTMVVDLFE